jgi:hypothetical protein
VELSHELAQLATANIRRMRRRKASAAEVLNVDATQFDLPTDANVIYFYNPFSGDVLERVTSNIHASLRACPRPMVILYVNDDHFKVIADRQPWLQRTREFKFYPNLTAGVYSTRV